MVEPSSLEIAIRRINKGRQLVARQRRLVEVLTADGRDAAAAERALDLFVATLRVFENQLEVLQEVAWYKIMGRAPRKSSSGR